MRLAEIEPPVEIVVTPDRRLLGHANHRPQRGLEEPPDRPSHQGHDDQGERERPEQRCAFRLFVWCERCPGHERTDPLVGNDHRRRVEANVAFWDIEKPAAIGEQLACCTIKCGSLLRLFDYFFRTEDPDLTVAECVVGRLRTTSRPCSSVSSPSSEFARARSSEFAL